MIPAINKGILQEPQKMTFQRDTQIPVKKNHSAGHCSPKIIAIGGGKGGIGKSFISANLGLLLAHMGKKVALVDLDLGAANVHTCLGVSHPALGLSDFMSRKVEHLADVGVNGGIEGLTLFGAGQEFWQQIRPESSQKIKLIGSLQKLNADFVIVDLGAGTHTNILDFFIFSHMGILVVVPEPTSIENAYIFAKSVLYRKIQSIAKALKKEEIVEQLLNQLSESKQTIPPAAILDSFKQQHPELGERIQKIIAITELGIIMNQVRVPSDLEIGHSMAQICQKYFGFHTRSLGHVAHDDAVWRAVRNRKAVYKEAPHSVAIEDLKKVAFALERQFYQETYAHVGT